MTVELKNDVIWYSEMNDFVLMLYFLRIEVIRQNNWIFVPKKIRWFFEEIQDEEYKIFFTQNWNSQKKAKEKQR